MHEDVMIEVKNLTKKYAGRVAVDNISFTVRRAEVVGLLGPNGAGKTTTMRIIAGFIPASSGTVKVAGLDVVQHSLEVRRRIGYMPENNPLYGDLRVIEYLRFRGQLKGLRKHQLRERIDAVMQRLEITNVSRKLIGQLSKGYRQRVGLADALLTNPDLLILDEPTIGLDPQQVRSVRELIRELSKQHTVLISTHILSEAEMICDRVLIINGGTLIAEGTPSKLAANLGAGTHIVVEVTGNIDGFAKKLSTLPNVEKIETQNMEDGFTKFTIAVKGDTDIRVAVFDIVVETSCKIRALSSVKLSLEDIYVQATKPKPSGEESEDES